MSSGDAAATFNILNMEKRNVVAALIARQDDEEAEK